MAHLTTVEVSETIRTNWENGLYVTEPVLIGALKIQVSGFGKTREEAIADLAAQVGKRLLHGVTFQ